MEENKETVVSTGEELEDTRSTDSKESHESKESKESKDSKEGKKWPDFRRLRVVKKVPEKVEKQDPNRFFGDGVNFKAKLIGIKEVDKARGDRLAQDALFELKDSVKTANTHKLKIIVNVSVEGIKIKDEKATQVLHHHPVHKISFIAQDITDPRAFGYVFGSPALGHRFFAIKTEKAAQLVVVAMRDLFQVVFEIRKKELQQKNENGVVSKQNGEKADGVDHKKEADSDAKPLADAVANVSLSPEAPISDTTDGPPVNYLLDLEEDSKEDASKQSSTDDDLFRMPTYDDKTSDPFFTDPLNFISSISTSMPSNAQDSFYTVNSQSSAAQSNSNPFETDSFDPPPLPSSLPPDESISQVPLFEAKFELPTSSTPSGKLDISSLDFSSNSSHKTDKYAPLAEISTVDGSSIAGGAGSNIFNDSFSSTSENECQGEGSVDLESPPPKPPRSSDIFSDLDPLGKDRPFVDKKDFFYEVKNPPKKVLKDLVEESRNSSCSPNSSVSGISPAGSSQSIGSFPSASSPPPPFHASFPNSPCNPFAESSSTNSSPFAIPASDLHAFEPFANNFVPSNVGFEDNFTSDEISLPSPTNPPPPPPQSLLPPPPPVPAVAGPPAPPPRPIGTIPPPLPPKRQQPSVAPLVKIGPEPKSNSFDDDFSATTRNETTKLGGTLPIPIPIRKIRGPVPRLGSCNSPRSVSSPGFALPSPSSSNTSMFSLPSPSSVNSLQSRPVLSTPRDSTHSTSSCDAGLLGDTSQTNLINRSDSVSSQPPATPPVQTNGVGSSWSSCSSVSSSSVISNGIPPPLPPPVSRVGQKRLDNRPNPATVFTTTTSNKGNNNANNFNNNNVFVSNQNAINGDFDSAWVKAATTTKDCGVSIFHRETDPFAADDFFMSLSVSAENERNGFGNYKKNPGSWSTSNPFDPMPLHEDR